LIIFIVVLASLIKGMTGFGLIALAGYGIWGLLSLTTFLMTFLFLPILYLPSFPGKRLNHRISPLIFKNISVMIPLISRLFLLLKCGCNI